MKKQLLIISREFPPHTLGGAGYHSYYMVKELLNNYRVTVLSGINNGSILNESDLIENPDFKIIRIPYYHKVLARNFFARAVVKHLKSTNLSCFHAIISHECIDISKISFQGKTILKTHFNIFRKHEQFQYFPPLQFLLRNTIWRMESHLEKLSLVSFDLVVHNSKLTRDLFFQKYLTLNQDKHHVIYNGIDLELFHHSQDKRKKQFLFIGGDNIRKGFTQILKLSHTLPKGYRIIIVGEIGSLSNRRLIESSNKIQCIGKVPQSKVKNLLQESRALIHPAVYEPFGNIILESLACGTPVLVSNESYCGASEIIPKKFSTLLDLKNELDLSKMDIPPLISRDQSREFLKQYTWEKHVFELMKIF